MARVTVEDCIDKVDSPYELVLVANYHDKRFDRTPEIVKELENSNQRITSVTLKKKRNAWVGCKERNDCGKWGFYCINRW